MSYGIVSTPWWSEVWIVACGPSARLFDLDRLKGKTVLAINSAYYLFSLLQLRMADVTTFSADPDWTRDHRDLLRYRKAERFVSLALDTHPDLADIPGVTYLKRSHLDGLSEHPGHLCMGGNSGYAAINLAYLKRATEIHLVGYDMAGNPKFAQWIPRFRTMLPQLEAAGVRVINHNSNSAIDAFDKAQGAHA